jgi:16S rRNA A1518/A1519 N6-dimethyltransferase RsmA/KsgA/DIM1 with predicted DNA glycosylase/AP lyase activity
MVPLGAGRPVARDEALFAKLVAAGFSQRRKTLRNSTRRSSTRKRLPGRASTRDDAAQDLVGGRIYCVGGCRDLNRVESTIRGTSGIQ